MLYRQGDVMIRQIPQLPEGARIPIPTGILAHGEVTGHCHRIADLGVGELFEIAALGVFMSISNDGVSIIHDEHSPLVLPLGDYEVSIQKEYTPSATRNVMD